METSLSIDIVRPNLKNTLHSNGHTYVDFENSSGTLITCNHADNEVYLFKPEELETGEPKCQIFGDDSSMNVTFVKVADDLAFVGLANSTVQIFTYPQFEKEGLLVRFESAPLCVDLNQDKSFAVIGTADGTVKTVELASPHRFKTFEGHTGPILTVCYDPSEDYIVTSSCDGTVKVWKCGDRKCVKTWECVPKSNSVENSKTLAKCCWQPGCGTHLAVPGDKNIKFFDRRHQNFLENPKLVFTHELIQDCVSMVCWHIEDGTMSTAGKDSSLISFVTIGTNIMIVEFVSNQCRPLLCIQGKQNKVTSFLWMPDSVNFVVADEIGMIYLYTGCVDSKSKRLASSESKQDAKLSMNETVKGADDVLNDMAKNFRSGENADEEDVEDGSISLDQIKQSYAMQVERGLDGDVEGDEDNSQGKPINFYGSGQPNQARPDPSTATNGPKVEIVSYQAPFQPSSSPASLSCRYMKWNLVGIVRREEHNQNDEDVQDDELIGASITVEFHDSTFHHAMHLNDDHGYTMADLNEEALLLASPASHFLENKASVIMCNTFSFWDHSSKWSTELPVGEKATALCLGSQSWLAVATSAGFLRIFSVSGLQLSVIMLPGHLVSISGGFDELLHVYQPSQTSQRDRFYAASIYKVSGFETNLTVTEQFPMCSADDSVVWIGFSQEGDAVVAFANGPVYLLKRSGSHGSGHCWLPVFNLKQHLNSKSDRLWIVGLTGKQLRGIYCKASKFPAQLPRPIVLTYNLGLPLCNLESEQSQMELELQNQRAFNSLTTQQLQSAFLKMFALACRTDRDCRAVDICNLMPNEETVILAIKYATKLKKLTLAQKLSAIAHDKASMNPSRIERQQSFTVFEDDNSRSLFSSQTVDSAANFSTGVPDEGAAESDNPILRRANNGKAIRSGGSALDSPTEGSFLSSPLTDDRRRRNPFVNDVLSKSMLSDKSAAVGSSVFDSLKLLKPEKLKVGESKPLTKRKSNTAASASSKIIFSEQENKQPTSGAPGVTKKMTPFQIFFEKIKASLEEESPEKSQEELLSMAMKRWKKLSAEEKEAELNGEAANENGLKRKTAADNDSVANGLAEDAAICAKKKKFDSALLDQFSFN